MQLLEKKTYPARRLRNLNLKPCFLVLYSIILLMSYKISHVRKNDFLHNRKQKFNMRHLAQSLFCFVHYSQYILYLEMNGKGMREIK